jgi:uncharacterized protein DUF2752
VYRDCVTSTDPQPLPAAGDGAGQVPTRPVAAGAAGPGWDHPGYPPPPGYPVPGPNGYVYAEPDRAVAFFNRLGQRSPRWLAPVVVVGCCAAASAYVLWSNPTDGGAAQLPTCLVKLTTGFDCPGCGGTRALWFLLHGDLPAAAEHHLLAVFAAPFLVYAYIVWAAGAIFRVRLPQLRISMRMSAIGLAAWAVFTVLRNLPFAPFTWFYV